MSNRQRPRPPARRRDDDGNRHPGDYLGQLVTLGQSGRLPIIPGTVAILDVLHDPDCRRPEGGPCTCVADVGTLTYPRIPKGAD